MWDDITCEYRLPARPHMQTRGFQTKSLDCRLAQYRVTANRRLLKLADADWQPVAYTGAIDFYDFDPLTVNAHDIGLQLGELVTFRARFWRGWLLWVREVETV